MDQKAKRPKELIFRVFADAHGKVFLMNKSGSAQVEVGLPVSKKTLAEAKNQLIDVEYNLLQSKRSELEAEITPAQKTAQDMIAETIDPIRRARWFKKLNYGSSYFLTQAMTFLTSALLVAASYKGVQYSSEHFPEWLHFIVLGLYIATLVFLLYMNSSEENRIKHHPKVKAWFGPHGMLVLPLTLIFAAAGVLASILFRLHQRGLIVLETCSGREVNEGGLMDFAVWHFLNIVPSLQLTSLLRRAEPYCYRQTRIGVMIAAFQVLVIIPCFNMIRFYWKHRGNPAEYLFHPYWKPKPKKP
jgi:hypothetical protein